MASLLVEERASSGADTDTEVSSDEKRVTTQPWDGEDHFNKIRLTKADLKNFPNYNSKSIPSSLEETASFIEEFIELEKVKKTPRKRKHSGQFALSEVQRENRITLERLDLRPDAIFQTKSDDFKLMIFHSKGESVCEAQLFTKTLVTDTAGEKIVSEKYSSSLIYFFYRILETDNMPEIFIITIGQTWRLAKKVGCDKFSSNVKVRELEKDAVHLKHLHADGGNVLTTERNARAGSRLNLFDEADLIEQKSTRYPKPESTLNEHTAFKTGSRIFFSDTAICFNLSLNIKEIHDFFKLISRISRSNELKIPKRMQKVADEQVVDKLDKQLLEHLATQDWTKIYLQHENTDEWVKINEVKIWVPNKDDPIRFDLPVSFHDVFAELRTEKIPETDWLQKVDVEWTVKEEPINLKYFLEDYVIMENMLYRYLFGQWWFVTYEYIADLDRKFQMLLSDCFLEASQDFPILPWLHSFSRIETQKGKKKPQEAMGGGDSAIETSQSPTSPQSTTLMDSSAKSVSQSPASQNHSQTMSLSDSGIYVSQSPASQSHSQNISPSIPDKHGPSDNIIDLGQLCGKSPENVENLDFKTEKVEIKNNIETIHDPVKVDFMQMIPDQGQVKDNKNIKLAYTVPVTKRVSSNTYTVPREKDCTRDELENLLYVRLSTKLIEAEYNDCHMLLGRILKKYKKDRFVIIPGDELFVAKHKNTELYDILISDEEEKITYVIHVKADLGNKTRDACSQLRISAEKIKESISIKSSKSPLAKYWETNQYQLRLNGYKGDAGFILYKLGKENFINLFADEKRRLVFVYACRDSRKKEDLEKEVEHASTMNFDLNEEQILKQHLQREGIPPKFIDNITDELKQKEILDANGCKTNAFNYQTGTDALLNDIALSAPPRKKTNVEKALKKTLKIHVPDSYIAKSELIDLEKDFQKFHVGKKQFEFKICQIPTKFYLK